MKIFVNSNNLTSDYTAPLSELEQAIESDKRVLWQNFKIGDTFYAEYDCTPYQLEFEVKALTETAVILYSKQQTTNTKHQTPNTKEIITKWVMFGYNYPPDFIQKVWGEGWLADHFQSKFNAKHEKYGANGVMNSFFSELDEGNRDLLTEWILTNYKG
jgi:hypothetical protein